MTGLNQRLVLAFTFLLAGATAHAAPPTAAEIKQAVKDLGNKRFAVREKASDFLRSAGQAAEPALKDALKSKDAEVSRRAKEILDEFQWGIYPETPTEVLKQIQAYRLGQGDAKRQAMEDLAKQGGAGYAALLKITSAEQDEAQRRLLMQYLALELPRAVPFLLLGGHEELAEQLLEKMLASRKEHHVRHYAAYLLQRNRLDAKIPQFQAEAAKPMGSDAAWVLSYLLRAQGNLPAAREAAEKANDKSLALLILAEELNWKELAKRTEAPPMEVDPDIELLAYRAAYRRLAGQPVELEKTLAAIQKAAAVEPDHSPASSQFAKALFLNDRPAEGLALLIAKKHDLAAFDVLKARNKYREAIDLAGKIKPDDSTPAHQVELRLANLLFFSLGEKDRALEHLGRAVDAANRLARADVRRDLIRAQVQLGRTEEAFEQCVAVLSTTWKEGSVVKTLDPESKIQSLDLVFPQRGTSALVWWDFLRKKYAGEKEAATMNRLRGLFGGKIATEELAKSANELERSVRGDKARDLAAALLAIAEVCEASNALDGAKVSLKKWAELHDSAASWQRLGDFAAKHGKDAKETAEYYDKAFRKDARQPLPLFLRGQVLSQIGQKEEGRRLIELAHRLPLGDDETRYTFAGALDERGFPNDARREYEIILRVGPGEGWYTNETTRHLAYDAMNRKEFDRAADLFERFRISCLRVNTSFVEYSAYVHVPAVAQQCRTRAALQAGRLDEAKRSLDQVFAALPGSVELPIEVVNALDKAGRGKEADEIFRRVFDLYEKHSAEWPRAASLHNSVAWVAAACRRELDKALLYAEKAVALAPQEAGFIDTLAEVCFQRGDKERAVMLMKRCVELEPANDYYPRQLQRIEKGDRKAPLPEQG